MMPSFFNHGRKIDTDIGSRLKQWRDKHDLSQEEVANMIGKKQPFIYKLENGKKTFTLETLQTIAANCDIDYIWLLTGIKVPSKRK
jgi:transcriptional regulator with XRE-family HTH domain